MQKCIRIVKKFTISPPFFFSDKVFVDTCIVPLWIGYVRVAWKYVDGPFDSFFKIIFYLRPSSSSNNEKREETSFEDDRNGNPGNPGNQEGQIQMNSLTDNIPLIDDDGDLNQVCFNSKLCALHAPCSGAHLRIL